MSTKLEIESSQPSSERRLKQESARLIQILNPLRQVLTTWYLGFLKKLSNLSVELEPERKIDSQKYLDQALSELQAGKSILVPFVPHKGSLDALVLFFVLSQWLSPNFFAIISSIKFELRRAISRGGVSQNMGRVTASGLVELIMRGLFSLDPLAMRLPIVQKYLIQQLKDPTDQQKANVHNQQMVDKMFENIHQHPLIVGISPEGSRGKTGGVQRVVRGSFSQFALHKNELSFFQPIVLTSPTGIKSDAKLHRIFEKTRIQVTFGQPLSLTEAGKLVGQFYFTDDVARWSTSRNPVQPGEKLHLDDIVMWWIVQDLPNEERGVYSEGCIGQKIDEDKGFSQKIETN